MTSAWLRRMAMMLAALLLLGGMAIPAAQADANTPIGVQCVADQKDAVPGGTLSFHILYHNVGNQAVAHATLKVQVKGDLEASDTGGATWDANAKTLAWNLTNVPANGAAVLQANLKVAADARTGDTLALGCSVQADNDLAVVLPDVTVKVGTEVDQPFFNGYLDGKFHPERNMTRAETAAVIVRIKGLTAMSDHVYPDVPQDHWAYRYIEEVTQAGYMVGDDQGRFRPDDPITRAEYVTLLLRVRGINPIPLTVSPDTIGHWSSDAVSTAEALGYVDVPSTLLFQPDQPIVRSFAARLTDIALQRGPLTNGDTNVVAHWPDVPATDASYGWIEEGSIVAHEAKQTDGVEKLIRYLPDQTKPM